MGRARKNLTQEYNGQTFLPSLHTLMQNYGVYDEASEGGSRDEKDYGACLLQKGHEGRNTQGKKGKPSYSPQPQVSSTSQGRGKASVPTL